MAAITAPASMFEASFALVLVMAVLVQASADRNMGTASARRLEMTPIGVTDNSAARATSVSLLLLPLEIWSTIL